VRCSILQRGFIFIEVLLVITVIGILATMAVPGLGRILADRELDGAARILASDLRYLQQLCMNTSPDDSFSQMIFRKAPPYGYIIAKGGKALKIVSFPNSVRLAWSPSTMTFGLRGDPVNDNRPAIPAKITLMSQRGNKFKYINIATTGRVRISDIDDSDD
jgi:prepilin-type N-terminal cleavage/methylation domain-containing protein